MMCRLLPLALIWFGPVESGANSKMIEQTDRSRVSGFTIVELLIVIVVIGILAALTIAAYNGIQRRAQVVAVVDGLSKVEKSMRLWMIDTDMTVWPLEPSTTGGTSFSDLIVENSSLNGYLQHTPAVAGVGTQEWFYDNDGPMKRPDNEPCDDMYRGVNIAIRYINDMRVVEGVNRAIDGGANKFNPYGCGKIRWHAAANGGILFYVLSPYGDFEG